MTAQTIDLGSRSVPAQLATLIRTARELIGWSQRDLADRAHTSQSMICRLEQGRTAAIDLLVLERVLSALGLRPSLGIDDLALLDRRRQADGLHAVLNGYAARRLDRLGWVPPTEVLVGRDRPRGWIDILAYRPADRALLIEETKADLPDMGAMQRRLAFYEREAWGAARRLGWQPRHSHVLVVGLDTASMGARLATNRDLLRAAFPAPVDVTAAWLADPALPPPAGWTFALADPRIRGERWLRPVPLGARRKPAAFLDYADAARRLLKS